MSDSELRQALEALADKMGERCGDHCLNSCQMCEARNNLLLILHRAYEQREYYDAEKQEGLRFCGRCNQRRYFSNGKCEMCVALGAEQIIEIDEDGKVHGDISGVKRTR